MAKQRKAWMFDTAKPAKSELPGTLKDEVDTKAGELIEGVLKPAPRDFAALVPLRSARPHRRRMELRVLLIVTAPSFARDF